MMTIGYTVWTYMLDEYGRGDNPTEHAADNFEQGVKEVSHLGYKHLENFNFIVPVFEKEPERLKEILDKYDMKLVNLYHTYYEDGLEGWLKLGERTCKLLQYCGASLLNVQGNIWKDPPMERPFNKESLDMYIDAFSKMGEISKEYGVTTCLHPHSNTSMFHEDEIDYFLSKSKNVALTMDTAHTTLAHMDAEKAFDKYGDLIKYVHMKDLDPNPNAHLDWPMKRFCALGQGCVDFKGVIRSLEKHGYNGTLCVEVDYPLICNYETAQFSRNYLRDVLGF